MPFRNLKLLIIFNKALGILSCKLVNSRLKSSSTWNRYFCMAWFLFHCLNASIYYYNINVATPKTDKKGLALANLRFGAYTASLLPYPFVAAFWSEHFVKLSEKLEMYDEQAITLGHPRKDKHVFVYLFFIYTFVASGCTAYYDMREGIAKGFMGILKVMHDTVPVISGTYCVFITCIFLDLIRQRFRHLNETIIPRVSKLPVTGSQGEITVYTVRQLHGVLLDGAKLIDALYGIGGLFTCLSLLLEYLMVIYIFVIDLKENLDMEDNVVDTLNLLFQTIYFGAMYHFTTYEVNRVEDRVIKYGLPFSSKKCRMVSFSFSSRNVSNNLINATGFRTKLK
ncbi:PREDICTED: uncharacterized protein LOC105556136 [Vollenhovia emeryi]|uniref:uncharacterized protein LOC105556136 n=1 Tax=Vollenhovia emeryi TaxID=411798 RepID=UPI0005F4C88B|nr:PREDICTED: uncharacterized protein LOC105556136 [Vollenhovia emeryi]